MGIASFSRATRAASVLRSGVSASPSSSIGLSDSASRGKTWSACGRGSIYCLVGVWPTNMKLRAAAVLAATLSASPAIWGRRGGP